jgi:hypothetical protein
MNRPGSAILTALMLLFGIFVVTMFGIDIMMNGIVRRRAEGASLKAYYVAEGASEQVFLAIKNNPGFVTSTCATTPKYYNFDAGNCSTTQVIKTYTANLPILYYSTVSTSPPGFAPFVTVISRASLMGTRRQIYTSYCLPSCNGVYSGGSDGCGGVCN